MLDSIDLNVINSTKNVKSLSLQNYYKVNN